MSGRDSFRGKSKIQYQRSRMRSSYSNNQRITQQVNQIEDSHGIYNNPQLSFVMCNTLMGNIIEITTYEDQIVNGIVRAISPSGDFCIDMYTVTDKTNKKNGHLKVDDVKVVLLRDIKCLIVRDAKKNDNIGREMLTDAEISRRSVAHKPSHPSSSVALKPFFDVSEDVLEDNLESVKQGEHWFKPEDMFQVNADRFQVQTTYKDNLPEYTIPLDTSAPDYEVRRQRAEQVARDIERDPGSRRAARMENEDEEELYSAVHRPGQPSGQQRYVGRGRPLKETNKMDKRSSPEKDPPAATSSPTEEKNTVEPVVSAPETPKEVTPPPATEVIVEEKEKKETEEDDDQQDLSVSLNPDAPEFQPRMPSANSQQPSPAPPPMVMMGVPAHMPPPMQQFMYHQPYTYPVMSPPMHPPPAHAMQTQHRHPRQVAPMMHYPPHAIPIYPQHYPGPYPPYGHPQPVPVNHRNTPPNGGQPPTTQPMMHAPFYTQPGPAPYWPPYTLVGPHIQPMVYQGPFPQHMHPPTAPQ